MNTQATLDQIVKLEKIQFLEFEDLLKLLCSKFDETYIPIIQSQYFQNAETKSIKNDVKQTLTELLKNCILFKNLFKENKNPLNAFSDITEDEIKLVIQGKLESNRINNISDPEIFAHLIKLLCELKLHFRKSEAINKDTTMKLFYERAKNAEKIKGITKPTNDEIRDEMQRIEREFLGRFNKIIKILLPLFMSEENAEIARPYFLQEIPEILTRTQGIMPDKSDLRLHVDYLFVELAKLSIDLYKPYSNIQEKISNIVNTGHEEMKTGIKMNLLMLTEEEKYKLFEGLQNGKIDFYLDKEIGELTANNSKSILQDIYDTYSIYQALYRKKYIKYDIDNISQDDETKLVEQKKICESTLRIISGEYANLIFIMHETIDKENEIKDNFNKNINKIIIQIKSILGQIKKMGQYIFIQDKYNIGNRRKTEKIIQVPINDMFSLVEQIKSDTKLILDLKYEFKKIISSERKFVKSGSLSNLFGYRFDFPDT